jgi:hypothetical protein
VEELQVFVLMVRHHCQQPQILVAVEVEVPLESLAELEALEDLV